VPGRIRIAAAVNALARNRDRVNVLFKQRLLAAKYWPQNELEIAWNS
tara:strand:- start:288 stop:428 length:141 start_codon:yes stop_codon:yes gene_type:complete